MEPAKGHKFYNTAYSSVKLMAYFEKNGLMDIVLKLFLKIVRERPADVRNFIVENIKEIATEVQTTRTVVLLPPIFDVDELVKLFKDFYNIPTIVYTKERKPGDTEEILEKYKKFLHHFGLERKHKIFINFPKNCEETAIFKQKNFEPNTVIEVRHGFQVPFKTREMMIADRVTFTREFKEVEDFYKNVFYSLKYGSRADCSDPNRDKSNQTVREIVNQLVTMMRNTIPKDHDHNHGRFAYRVVFFGRRGSGRKTQALALAKRFNLVYINVETLILEYLKSPCALGDMLREGLEENNQISNTAVAAVLYKRVLQKDCITNGWVIVGFPYNVEGFKLIYEFIVPPNKIIFLHCRERVALLRIIKRTERNNSCECNKPKCRKCQKGPKDMMKYIQKEMDFFNMNKKEILEYLAEKKETIHVDGNHSSKTVKTFIWARVVQIQHKIGMTYPLN